MLLLLACQGPPQETARTSDEPPRRLVALAPNLVEILFDLGLGDRVVGVGDYAHWPPEVEGLPRLGGLLDPHLEEMLHLKPDLVVLIRSEAELASRLERLGIETLVVGADTLEEIGTTYREIAARTGAEARCREALGSWQERLAPRPIGEERRVLLVVGRPPGPLREVFVAGSGTFLSELLERLGARNAFADLALPYPQVALDAILEHRPDLIVELQGERLAATRVAELQDDWQRLLPDSPPVVVLHGSHVLIPGPRLPRLYEELAAALGGPP